MGPAEGEEEEAADATFGKTRNISARGGGEGEGAAAALSSLQIVDAPPGGEAAAAGTAAALPTAPPLAAVATHGGEAAEISVGGGAQGPNAKVCAITGAPAKYRDPISGLPYADLAAFKELRKLYPDPKKEQKEAAAKAAAEAAEAAKAAAEGAAAEGGGQDGEGGEGEPQAADDTIEVIRPKAKREITMGNDFFRRVNKVV
jgi:hypothetical protein